MSEPSVLEVTPENIWNYKQNRASLVTRDMNRLYGIPEVKTAKVLMSRGVYKWLAARRDVIRLKNVWRDRLTELYTTIGDLPPKERAEARGRIKAIEECRAELRAICHSERWRFSDHDQKDPLRQMTGDNR